MSKQVTSLWDELSTPSQVLQLATLARQRNWGLSLIVVGWLHLFCFSLCYYLTIIQSYHEAAGYLAIWAGELLGVALIFRLCGGPRPANVPSLPLARFVTRLWMSYFFLAFFLYSLNAVRGHEMFELSPALASLASFAFLVLTFAISRRFFAAVLVMFAAGLLMAAYLLHAYLIFALAWWGVLNSIGSWLWWAGRNWVRLGTGASENGHSGGRPPRAFGPSLGYRNGADAGRPDWN